jgi:Reverse transcriptase (RNA-dependent DNA polymerase)
MLPIPADVLKRLRLNEAITHEAQSWQTLLPTSPGWDQVSSNASLLAQWLSGQLRAGMPTSQDVIVSARKAPHGVRPVPVWGLAERITYRALVDFLLRNEPELDRSPEAYLEFIGAPVKYAQSQVPRSRGRVLIPRSSSVQYVVQTDIAAFYEGVDHGILSRELLTRTGDYPAIECLMSLLGEVQGRSFGLPQLLEPSDRLSEIYIDVVERDVLRHGWAVWRFNDDFRVAVRDYGDALGAIEDLARAAREVGLTLSDLKTTTPRFTTYLLRNFGLAVDDEIPADLQRQEPEEAVGDYTEGVGEVDPSWAVSLVSDANTPEMKGRQRNKDGINLARVRGEEYRVLRRALGRLIRERSADALPHVLKLFAYVPSLTPWTTRYVIAAGQNGEQLRQAVQVLDEVINNVSLGDWQRVWVIRAFDELEALDPSAPGEPDRRVSWTSGLLHSRSGPIVAAEAALALAAVDATEFADLEYALRTQPVALVPWYLTAIQRLRGRGQVSDDQYAALRREGGLHAALLPEES